MIRRHISMHHGNMPAIRSDYTHRCRGAGSDLRLTDTVHGRDGEIAVGVPVPGLTLLALLPSVYPFRVLLAWTGMYSSRGGATVGVGSWRRTGSRRSVVTGVVVSTAITRTQIYKIHRIDYQ